MNCNIYTVIYFLMEKITRSDGGSFRGNPCNLVFSSLKSTIRFTVSGVERISKFLALTLWPWKWTFK